MEEKIIQLAALLHDIGKFWQGTSKPGSHQELSAKFIETYVLPKEWQPSLKEQQEVIVVADWLSSGEKVEREEKEEAEKRKNTPLTSIFSKVEIEKGELPSERYYPIKHLALDKGTLLPEKDNVKNDLTEDYEDLWNEFEKELEKIKVISDFDAYFNTLYYLLQKYTWCIPSAVGKAKSDDVSLFDHLKTTCAIASCLCKSNAEEKYLDNLISGMETSWRKEELNEEEKIALNDDKFLLLGGDISGVQKFIYSITSEGAVKGLRGRSFYLELFSESIAEYILRKLNLPVTNLLYCGGGHFYVLAPGIVEKDLEGIQREITERLLKIHGGELYLVLEWLRLSANDFQKFGDAWANIGKKIAERKKRKYQDILEKKYEDIFGPFDEGGTKPFCDVCGSEIKEGERCNFCKSLEDLAKKLSEAKYIVEIINDKRWKRAKKGTWEDLLSEFGFRYEFRSELGADIKRIDAEHICIYKLNDTKFLDCDSLLDVKDVKSHVSFEFKFLAKETPYTIEIPDIEGKSYKKPEIKEFSDLAKDSEGIKNWAVLRADVDNLGKIFTEGLGGDRTILRVSNLSTMLSLFFRGWLEKICEDGEYKGKVYAIYSGGDDLFVVGAWDKMPEIGKKIYEDFRTFTCTNPNITLSAGITIAPSEKYPLYQAADLAGEALDKSKGLGEKDGITFFDVPIKWDKFGGAITELKEDLKNLLDAGVSRALLQKLYGVYGEYNSQRRKHGETLARYDDRYGRWRWLLAWVIKGTKVPDERKDVLEEVEGLILDRNIIEYSPVALRWVEFLTRKEGVK